MSIEKRVHPIPFRTRKLSASSPMILRIFTWESRPMPRLSLERLLFRSLSSFKGPFSSERPFLRLKVFPTELSGVFDGFPGEESRRRENVRYDDAVQKMKTALRELLEGPALVEGQLRRYLIRSGGNRPSQTTHQILSSDAQDEGGRTRPAPGSSAAERSV